MLTSPGILISFAAIAVIMAMFHVQQRPDLVERTAIYSALGLTLYTCFALISAGGWAICPFCG